MSVIPMVTALLVEYLKPRALIVIQNFGGLVASVNPYAPVNNSSQCLFVNKEVYFIIEHGFGIGSVHKAQVLRNSVVEYYLSDSGVNELGLLNTIISP